TEDRLCETEQPAGGLHFIGKKDELIEAKRSFRTVDGRDILIIHHQGVFYAMDCYCYHAGGTLENGDIEEINGKLCIICPKHKYKISLCEGEGLYRGRNPQEEPPVYRWYSKGVKQRTHTVTETNGEIFVKMSSQPGWIDSDYYQGEKGKIERAKAEAEKDETKKNEKEIKSFLYN
uniref:Rieske domain-containing protein n=1 Tax=Nothobranchius furzeri TaxID=105023 RepID=A0A8C6L8K3_NOTFU